jgi:alpha-tubulin suppressor-like RCC1 family protein
MSLHAAGNILANGEEWWAWTPYATYATNLTTNDILSVGMGTNFGCALRRNGQVWCWGNNENGQIGQSNLTSDYLTALQIQSWSDVIHIALSSDSNHVCAIRQDSLVNSVWCWGDNQYSQLGAGSSPTPGFTPSAAPSTSPSNTPASTVTPSASPAGGVTPSPTPSNSPSTSVASSPITTDYQYTPQYVSIPVM